MGQLKLVIKFIIGVIILCAIIISSELIGETYYAKIPAPHLLIIGIAGWLFIELIRYIVMPCYNCKGYGSINLKTWQKPINHIFTGWLGEKCPVCKGSGIRHILREMPSSEIIALNKKYKDAFGRDYHAFSKIVRRNK